MSVVSYMKVQVQSFTNQAHQTDIFNYLHQPGRTEQSRSITAFGRKALGPNGTLVDVLKLILKVNTKSLGHLHCLYFRKQLLFCAEDIPTCTHSLFWIIRSLYHTTIMVCWTQWAKSQKECFGNDSRRTLLLQAVSPQQQSLRKGQNSKVVGRRSLSLMDDCGPRGNRGRWANTRLHTFVGLSVFPQLPLLSR